MLRALYRRLMRLAGARGSAFVLAVVSFADSIVLPLPPDVLLVPMVLMQRARAVALAALCTAASVAGAMVAYVLGLYFFETVGANLLAVYGWEPQLARFRAAYQEHGGALVLLAAVSVFPFKLAALASGVLGMNFTAFVALSLAGRGARFFVLAILCKIYGDAILRFIARWFNWVMLAGGVFVGGLIWLTR